MIIVFVNVLRMWCGFETTKPQMFVVWFSSTRKVVVIFIKWPWNTRF